MSKMDWERNVPGSLRSGRSEACVQLLSPLLGVAEIEKLPGLLRDLFLSPGLINEYSIRFDAWSVRADLPKGFKPAVHGKESPANDAGQSHQASKNRPGGFPDPQPYQDRQKQHPYDDLG